MQGDLRCSVIDITSMDERSTWKFQCYTAVPINLKISNFYCVYFQCRLDICFKFV